MGTMKSPSKPVSLPTQISLRDRTMLATSLVTGLAYFTVSYNTLALSPIDLKDDRKAKSNGFDLIYEARDLDLPQNVRDGLTQARSSTGDTKKRVAESKTRITKEVLPYIEKAYWTEAK